MALYELSDKQVALLKELVSDAAGQANEAFKMADGAFTGLVLRYLADLAARLEGCDEALNKPVNSHPPLMTYIFTYDTLKARYFEGIRLGTDAWEVLCDGEQWRRLGSRSNLGELLAIVPFKESVVLKPEESL